MMRTFTLLLASLALASLGAAQSASFTNYGSGCQLPGAPPPLIRANALPILGTAFTVRAVALPNGQTPVSIDWPVLVTGFRQTTTPVPVLSGLQPANCNLLVSPDIIQFMPWLGSAYQDQFTIQIPNDPGFLGFTFYQQWAELYSRCQPTCTPQMIRVSDAAIIVVGT